MMNQFLEFDSRSEQLISRAAGLPFTHLTKHVIVHRSQLLYISFGFEHVFFVFGFFCTKYYKAVLSFILMTHPGAEHGSQLVREMIEAIEIKKFHIRRGCMYTMMNSKLKPQHPKQKLYCLALELQIVHHRTISWIQEYFPCSSFALSIHHLLLPRCAPRY